MRSMPINRRDKIRSTALGHRPGTGGRKYKRWQELVRVGKHRWAPNKLTIPPGRKDRDRK